MLKNKCLNLPSLLIKLLFVSIVLPACNPLQAVKNPKATVSAEASFCNQSTTYADGLTATGQAFFRKRLSDNFSGDNFRLSDSESSNRPIKFAEVRVINKSTGQTVQCGSTDSNGNLRALNSTVNPLRIPNVAGEYTFYVYARSKYEFGANNAKTDFRIKDDIWANEVYSISKDFNVIVGNNPAIGNIIAYANEATSAKIEGAAFNIYNNIITTYEYIKDNVGAQDLSCLSQQPLSVYWMAGFNPYQYVYPDEDPGDLSPLSFYLRSDHEIYISGGMIGNVSQADTDHFDDAVIIHELGHHIENVCSRMVSPGGQHSGNMLIDPRLAWSEGFGNFFAVHILKNKKMDIQPSYASDWLFYLDTQGYGSVNGYELIRFNLSRAGNNTNEYLVTADGSGTIPFDPVDPSTNPGESDFREVSISRGLFKITNSCASNCVGSSVFSDMWKSLRDLSSSYYSNAANFIDNLRKNLVDSGGSVPAAITNTLTADEAFVYYNSSSPWPLYGTTLVPSAVPCVFEMSPRDNIHITRGSGTLHYYYSDQRFSNHFFQIKQSELPNVSTVTIEVIDSLPAGASLDLLLFNTSYRFNEDCPNNTYADLIAPSRACNRSVSGASASARSPAATKNLNIAGIGTLPYMLNIRTYIPVSNQAIAGSYTYQLKTNHGDFLCPKSTY